MSMRYKLFHTHHRDGGPFAVGISEFPLVVGDTIVVENGDTYLVEGRRMKHVDMPPKKDGPWSAFLSIKWADLYVTRVKT